MSDDFAATTLDKEAMSFDAPVAEPAEPGPTCAGTLAAVPAEASPTEPAAPLVPMPAPESVPGRVARCIGALLWALTCAACGESPAAVPTEAVPTSAPIEAVSETHVIDPPEAAPLQVEPCPEPRPRTDATVTLRGRVTDADGERGVSGAAVELVAVGLRADGAPPCPVIAAAAVTDARGQFELESADYGRLSSCERSALPFVFDHFTVGGENPRTYSFAQLTELDDVAIRTSATRDVVLDFRCVGQQGGPPSVRADWLPGRDLYAEAALEMVGEPGRYRVTLELPMGLTQISVSSSCGPAFTEVEVSEGGGPLSVSLRAPEPGAGSLRVDVPLPEGAERMSVQLMRGPAAVQTLLPGRTLIEGLPPVDTRLRQL